MEAKSSVGSGQAHGVPVVDLFAGAGGLSLGAQDAGADVRLMVELDPTACATLRSNTRHRAGVVLEDDVQLLKGRDLRALAGLSRSDPLVVVGGAPCQPFSKAAYWTDPGDDAAFRRARAEGRAAKRPQPIKKARPDARRSLIEEYLRLVFESKADGFVFENVPSITHPRNRKAFEGFLADARHAGYQVTWFKANAAEFGAPQLRERVFVLGSKRRLSGVPLPTHSREGNQLGLRPAVPAEKAIRGLDASRYHEPEEVVEGKWANHLREIPPGSNYKHHTAWAGHPRPTFEAERRFWNFLLKLSPDLPSWTIPASPGPWTGPFHWDSRRLRTVELAALQTFPRTYRFTGSRRERVRQIGNAVPVVLARRVVAELLAAVEPGTTKPRHQVVA